MRKYIYSLCIILISITLQAQKIKIKKIKKLPINKEAFFPTFGKTNNEIFITGQNKKGLSLYNIKSKKETIISEELGAGVNPKFDESGIITYQITKFSKGRKQVEFKSYNASNQIQIPRVDRSLNTTAKSEGKAIVITNQGNDTLLAPLGEHYYIWVSLSPNKDRIVFTALAKGTFIADLKGNVLAEIGYLNAPVWANNNWIIGMNDKDDNERVTESTIEAVNISTGKKFVLTDKEKLILQYPKVSERGDRIVFHSSKGEIYYAKLRIKE